MAGYGDWTKMAPVQDFIDRPRPLVINMGERRSAGARRGDQGLRICIEVRVVPGSTMNQVHLERGLPINLHLSKE